MGFSQDYYTLSPPNRQPN